MDHGGMHHHDMAPNNNGTMHHKMMMMHMTFFWGKNAQILFSNWPGSSTGMYVLSLISVFLVSMTVEWISHSGFLKQGSGRVLAGILQTVMHTMRVGLSYLVMLALMSFNGGVFLAAVAGHGFGFLVFGSWVFKREEMVQYEKRRDLPPMTC